MREPIFSKQTGISIRWKLAAYLSVFIAIVLIVTWVFQVYLLNNFYEMIKRRELLNSSSTLAEHIESEDISVLAYTYALNCTMSVSIYRFEEEVLIPIVNVDATGQSGIKIPDHQLARYYRKAAENNGIYLGKFTFGGYEVDPNVSNSEDRNEPNKQNADKANVRLVQLQLVQGESGRSYLIVLNAGLQPLAATVQTLRTQFLWTLSILLCCAGVMVFLLYRHISAPLMRMNDSAKQLALGRYDVEFSGLGYRETRELADTLNYASHELSRLDRLQKELIANISHDLRTPLTMIKGYSEVMRDIPGENTAENMQVVIDETTRLSELVNDLLDLSKIQSGSRKLDPERFDLTFAVEEIMKRYDTFVRHKGYHITFESDQGAQVYGDRSMILQVLYNLINNAINYTGEDHTVIVQQSVRDMRVRISVTDTGEGIEEDQMPLIWDRYYKVDKVHRRAMIGTGLGLSIVKEILELHQAAYGVDSRIGVGSTFWFELPILPDNDRNSDSYHTEE